MKNILFLGGAAAALLYFLRQKRAAGENLRVEPVDIAIDSARSSSSFWTRIYYNVKLKLINTESASVNVSGINLNVLVNNTPFGSINNTTGFIVNAGSERIVNLEASFSSLGVIQAIRDLISDGLKFNVVVSGYVDTDLGRIAVNFSKNVGSEGISGRPKEYELGFYSLGNGTTVANRKKSIRGDYEQIAHISDSGFVTLYKKNLPVEILDQIYKKADSYKS
jgi:LEA14-like dessication related protein